MVEEIFQTGSQKVDDQDVVEALLPEVVNIGDSGCRQSVVVLKVRNEVMKMQTRHQGDGGRGSAI